VTVVVTALAIVFVSVLDTAHDPRGRGRGPIPNPTPIPTPNPIPTPRPGPRSDTDPGSSAALGLKSPLRQTGIRA
jgi:hypothetical protein